MDEKELKPNLVEVIPISKSVSKDTLSYYSFDEAPIGSIVKAPLRKKTIPALVIETKPAELEKTQIKNSSFKFKKIEKFKPRTIFSQEFVSSVMESAKFFACQTGSALEAFTPKKILENAGEISEYKETEISEKTKKTENNDESKTIAENYILQSDDDERFSTYRSLIRESFAKRQSIFMVLPTLQETRKTYDALSKGIERYTIVLHNSLSKSELIRLWNLAVTEEHSVFIIATGSFLGIPRKDIKTIIVERENSRAYKQIFRPFADVRIFAEVLAKKIEAKFILGDAVVRTETMWRHENHELVELSPIKVRSLSKSRQEIIDMKKEKETDEFKVISEDLKKMISDTRSVNENIFIFSVRRGLSPSTICGDCGSLVLCDLCSAPIVLHSNSKGNFFMCHQCGKKRSAEEACKTCGSWKLQTFGVGIELLERKISQEFPDAKIFRLDKDSASTEKRAQEIAKKFYASPGSILLGTEMAINYLDKEIDNTAVASIDSLFAIPDFRIKEKVLYIILKIRSLTKKNFLIQTRDPQMKALDYALKGNLIDFYREEITEREKYNYPPFSTFIKISLQGEKKKVFDEMEKLKNLLLPHMLFVFPAFIETVKKKYQMHGIIKLDREKWPDKDLVNKLLALPPQFSINVDPESLL